MMIPDTDGRRLLVHERHQTLTRDAVRGAPAPLAQAARRRSRRRVGLPALLLAVRPAGRR
jgi:hypothetical protein